jgi:hypothetical protein
LQVGLETLQQYIKNMEDKKWKIKRVY